MQEYIKKISGSGNTTLIISNEEVNDIIKIVQALEDSLIFKSNLELALSIILKQRELYESKHVSEECRRFQKILIFY